jgi:mono/diheme cytochrome c family protein
MNPAFAGPRIFHIGSILNVDFPPFRSFIPAMSDTSHKVPKTPAYYLGKFYEIFVVLVLIAMLGFLGVAFLGSGGLKVSPVTAAEAAPASASPASPAAAPASAEVAATATSPAPAPAAQGSAPAAGPASAPSGNLDPAQMALGKSTYMTCAACHGMDGTGLKAGPALMAPSFVGSKTLLGDPNIPLLVVLKGIAKENMDYMGMMAALGGALDDEKLAAVLTYVRNSFGNSASPITTEQAAAARAKFAAINAPAGVKRAELEAIATGH